MSTGTETENRKGMSQRYNKTPYCISERNKHCKKKRGGVGIFLEKLNVKLLGGKKDNNRCYPASF